MIVPAGYRRLRKPVCGVWRGAPGAKHKEWHTREQKINEKPNWISACVVSQDVWFSLTRFSWILHGINYSVTLGNTTNILSPGHAVHWPSSWSYPLNSRPYSARLCSFRSPQSVRPATFPNNLNFLFLTISGSVSYFPMCSPTLLCMSTLHGRRSMRGIMHYASNIRENK